MAALTAQPPGITANSLVMHFSPGRGNSATRNTMSCTAMPTHRTEGAPLEEGTVALHPAADDVMRDGDRRRTGQALGMFTHQHRGALILAEPAQADELVLVHRQIFVQGLGVGADHHRHRKRPWL